MTEEGPSCSGGGSVGSGWEESQQMLVGMVIVKTRSLSVSGITDWESGTQQSGNQAAHRLQRL